jgi:hypothetical protein
MEDIVPDPRSGLRAIRSPLKDWSVSCSQRGQVPVSLRTMFQP